MFQTGRNGPSVGVAALVLAMVCCAVNANPLHEIKSLKGDATVGPDGQITISYEVLIKEYNAQTQYELVFYATEDGRQLVDKDGRVLEQVVPIGAAVVNNKGEASFKGRVALEVFTGQVPDPKRIRVHALLVFAGDNRPLAHKETKLKVKD
jgi:hypothetical protein